MKVVAIIQARMGSTRLPGKVLMDLAGKPMLAFMVKRLSLAHSLREMWVATSTLAQDDPIATLCSSLGVPCHRGPEEDVLERYRQAADVSKADVVVRLTADCPLICPEVVDKVVTAFLDTMPTADYATNCLRRTYPRGLDTEVLPSGVLDTAAREAREPADREHVTRFVWRQPDRFRQVSVEDAEDHSALRWTVDTAEDLRLVHLIVGALGRDSAMADYRSILSLLHANPEWSAINADVRQKAI